MLLFIASLPMYQKSIKLRIDHKQVKNYVKLV